MHYLFRDIIKLLTMTSNTFQIQNFYKEGKTEYYTILAPNGATIDFAGQVPEYFALTHFNRISKCLNCIGLKWCGVIMGMCANCGLDTGAQKGFINYGQECEDVSHTNLPSVFDMGQYLHEFDDLTKIGDKSFENTIYIMVDELSDHLLYKFGHEKHTAILGLRAYLRSLDHDPRQAIMRINDAWDIHEEELYGRNWANLHWANLFGPHYDENDYIGSDDDDNDENPLHIDYDYKMTNARETQEEEERQCEASSQSSIDYSPMPALIPIFTRTDTEYHYGLDQNESESEVDYRMYLSDRRRGASLDTDDDAVSEISNGDVGEVDNANLSAEQQDQIYQVIEDACVNSTP